MDNGNSKDNTCKILTTKDPPPPEGFAAYSNFLDKRLAFRPTDKRACDYLVRWGDRFQIERRF
jgi:hypothetical protein